MRIQKNNFKFNITALFEGLLSIFRHGSKILKEGDSNIFYLNYARSGLLLALKSLHLPKGSKVGVMMFNCHTVANAIELAGYQPVFIDVTNNFTLDLEDLKRKRGTMSAIIISHLFGFYSDVDGVRVICPNIPVIEDCAHAYLSLDNEDKLVGYKGDFSCFSLGLGKFPSIGGGGILRVNNLNYLTIIKRDFKSLKSPSFIFELTLLIRDFCKSTLAHSVWLEILFNFFKSNDTKDNVIHHKVTRMPKSMYRLYAINIDKFYFFVEKQRQITKRLLSVLANKKDIIIPDVIIKRNNCIMLPILVQNRSELVRKLCDNNLYFSEQYQNVKTIMSRFGYVKDSCPNAEFISETNLIIPSHYNLNEKQVDRMCDIIQRIL